MTTPSMTGSAPAIPLADLAAQDAIVFVDGECGPHLLGSVCDVCGATFFPQRTLCFECLSTSVRETELSATGTLYSWTTVHVSSTRATPYTLGYVDLPGGLRILSDIAGPVQDSDFDARVSLVVHGTEWSFAVVEEREV